MSEGYRTLTERERQTLRLIVRGHDAKSIARHLDLSVHTVNERLRDARRKLGVSSSREAARLLFDREGFTPQELGDRQIGDVAAPRTADAGGRSHADPGRARRPIPILTGAAVMSAALALLAFALVPPSTPPAPSAGARSAADTQVADTQAAEAEAAARAWLSLVDAGRWDDSWAATGAAFRKLNTAQVWAAASARVRTPLGAMVSRTLLSREEVPAPPNGYMLVKFRTSFANKAAAIETLSLNREGDRWRVVGIYVG